MNISCELSLMDMNPFLCGFIGQWHMVLRCNEDSSILSALYS